ncbi:Ubiquitin/60s ribosomal protein L40 fusion [Trachipleistophora hominis]|uniref:Ubiquitin/60s ribosomal protein L40 fusion n=1 Tax=Trachipleistophora hominis TaxID=72359 RepID=L7JUL8_TRAHO|nr:Ubiquitin/60s ribosomal protein L40 fusion [Trachipleistophora hominis]
MRIILHHSNSTKMLDIPTYNHLLSFAPDHLLTTNGMLLTPQNFQFMAPFSHVNATVRLMGGALSEDDRALAAKRLNVQVCRKCYARLSARAEHCRKRACGFSRKLRAKKKIRETSKK